ncbi:MULTISPECIES: hypothetical protein [Aerosakkonema]
MGSLRSVPAAAPMTLPETVVAQAVASAPAHITGPTPGIAQAPIPTNLTE